MSVSVRRRNDRLDLPACRLGRPRLRGGAGVNSVMVDCTPSQCRGQPSVPCHARTGSPLTKCQTANDKATYVDFRISGLVPNALDRWKTWGGHPVYRVVLAANVDDDGTRTFAAKLAVLEPQRFSVHNNEGDRKDYRSDHEEHDCLDEDPHPRVLRLSKLVIVSLSMEVAGTMGVFVIPAAHRVRRDDPHVVVATGGAIETAALPSGA